MKKHEKEVIQAELDAETKVLRDLERQYQAALKDVDDKLAQLLGRSDADMPNVIYQAEHQRALRSQIHGILEQLQANEFQTISDFLASSYQQSFVGTMYSMHNQGIPLILPIDQNAMVKAVTTNSRLSEDLYSSLGVDIKKLNNAVRSEISRGISAGLSYNEIARNIANASKAPKSRAATIVRTEAHRIREESRNDARDMAKKKGADVVKQWDATLDGNTRDSHRKLDGQIKELDEYFEVGTHKAKHPGDFGRPEEDCNCRCVCLTRARWELDESELETLKKRAEFFGLDKSADFAAFEKNYINASKTLQNVGNNDIIISGKYDEYSRIFRDLGSDKTTEAVKDAQKTNPNFSNKTYEYTHNCQRCVPAWEYRQKGYDVIAQPCQAAGTHDTFRTSPFSMWEFNAFDPDNTKRVQADREGNGKNKIIEFLKECGNGARAEIVVSWEYSPEEGHAFAAMNIDGEILFIDPQNGKSGEYVEQYFERVVKGETRWLRIDNLSLREGSRGDIIGSP